MFILSIPGEPEDRILFEDIYKGYYKQMLYVANRILDNPADAEDAVQDALLRIARNIASLRNQQSWAIRGYVLTIAKNSALNILRKRSRIVPFNEDFAENYTLDDPVFQQVVNSLDYERLVHAIRHMDPLYRQVLTLVYVHKQTPKEVADLLGRKVDTVRKQLNRGRRLLLDYCKKEGFDYENK